MKTCPDCDKKRRFFQSALCEVCEEKRNEKHRLKYLEKGKITSGFYRGHIGAAVDEEWYSSFDFGYYRVYRLKLEDGREVYIKAKSVEKIEV